MRIQAEPGRLVVSVDVEADPTVSFGLISDPSELNGLTPSWFRLRFSEPPRDPSEVGPGTEFRYRLGLGPVVVPWVSRIEHWNPPFQFSYVQTSGPYRSFWHDHRLEEHADGCTITDELKYTLYSGPLGHRTVVLPMLRSIFGFRSAALRDRLGARRSSA